MTLIQTRFTRPLLVDCPIASLEQDTEATTVDQKILAAALLSQALSSILFETSSSLESGCIALLALEEEPHPFINHLLNHDLFVGSPSVFSRCTACAYFSSVCKQMASASGLLDLKPASKPTNKVKGQSNSTVKSSS